MEYIGEFITNLRLTLKKSLVKLATAVWQVSEAPIIRNLACDTDALLQKKNFFVRLRTYV